MKLIGLSLLSIFAISCTGGGSGPADAIIHSNAECPTNLAGRYQEIDKNEGFTFSKTVVFEKNSEGVYQLVDGVDNGATPIIVDGKSHSFDYENEDGEKQIAAYTAKCSKNKVYVNASDKNMEITSVISVDVDGNYVSNSTMSGNGVKETSSEKMTRVAVDSKKVSANECPQLEGDYINLKSSATQKVTQSEGKINFPSERVDYILDGKDYSNGYVTISASCDTGEIKVSKSLRANDLALDYEIKVKKTRAGFEFIKKDLSTNVETVEYWIKKKF